MVRCVAFLEGNAKIARYLNYRISGNRKTMTAIVSSRTVVIAMTSMMEHLHDEGR